MFIGVGLLLLCAVVNGQFAIKPVKIDNGGLEGPPIGGLLNYEDVAVAAKDCMDHCKTQGDASTACGRGCRLAEIHKGSDKSCLEGCDVAYPEESQNKEACKTGCLEHQSKVDMPPAAENMPLFKMSMMKIRIADGHEQVQRKNLEVFHTAGGGLRVEGGPTVVKDYDLSSGGEALSGGSLGLSRFNEMVRQISGARSREMSNHQMHRQIDFSRLFGHELPKHQNEFPSAVVFAPRHPEPEQEPEQSLSSQLRCMWHRVPRGLQISALVVTVLLVFTTLYLLTATLCRCNRAHRLRRTRSVSRLALIEEDELMGRDLPPKYAPTLVPQSEVGMVTKPTPPAYVTDAAGDQIV